MNPEASEAIRIADEHLSGASIERRKALALDIQAAIVKCAGAIASEVITLAIRKLEGEATLTSTQREKP